jgi:hypothetical protein
MAYLRKSFVWISLLAIAALPVMAADASLMKMVMPDAEFIMGVDVERIKGSPFGQLILSEMQKKEGGDQDLQKFIEMTGFDPRRDLKEVVVAARDTSAAMRNKDNPRDAAKGALVMVRGLFDESKIRAAAGADDTVSASTYKGVLMLTKGQEKEAVGLLGGSVLVLGNGVEVQAAIDRYQGAAGPPAALGSKVSRASTQYDVWIVGAVSPSKFAAQVDEPHAGGAMAGNLMKAIQGFTGGLRLGTVVELAGELAMQSDQDASAFVDAMRFLAGMAQGNTGQQNPIGGLLESMQLNAAGSTVNFSLSAPLTDLEKMFKARGAQMRKISTGI